jgi:hypothetical protein
MDGRVVYKQRMGNWEIEEDLVEWNDWMGSIWTAELFTNKEWGDCKNGRGHIHVHNLRNQDEAIM